MAEEYHGVSEINRKYISYYAQLFEVYEDFLFVEHYYPIIHKAIKKNEVSLMGYEGVTSTYEAPFKKHLIYGIVDRTLKKTNPARSLFEAVTLTEHFLQALAYRVYRDHPHKLLGLEESPDQKEKFLKIIIDTDDKSEMISKIAEEKIRGIFYGKPTDFFYKDKAKIGIDKNIGTYYKVALENYEEVVARRNIYVHNSGKVDRKYLREVVSTTYSLGQKPKIDKSYLKQSIQILQGLTSVITKQVIQANYPNAGINSKISKYIKRFEKDWKGK
jgi:hypothetical protein